MCEFFFFFFSSRRRHTRWPRDWSSDVCSSDLPPAAAAGLSRTLVEGLWICSLGDADGGLCDRFAGAAGGIQNRTRQHTQVAGCRCRSHSDSDVSNLVCAEFTGACRHLCCCRDSLGAGLFSGRQDVGKCSVFLARCSFQRDSDCDSAGPGCLGDLSALGIPLSRSFAKQKDGALWSFTSNEFGCIPASCFAVGLVVWVALARERVHVWKRGICSLEGNSDNESAADTAGVCA